MCKFDDEMDRKQKVLLMLKPKVKAFGFNRKELQCIAAGIADNLTSADDASEEDVNAEIEERIEAVLPFLQVGQSYANRLAEDARRRNADDIDDEGNDTNDDDRGDAGQSSSKKGKKNSNVSGDAPEWANALLKNIETLTNEVSVLKGEKLLESRKSRLQELLKDSGSYGNRILKSFGRMKFDTDEDFEDFFSEVEEDLKGYEQEMADKGLSALSNPPAAKGGKGGAEKELEPFSDEDISRMAEGF